MIRVFSGWVTLHEARLIHYTAIINTPWHTQPPNSHYTEMLAVNPSVCLSFTVCLHEVGIIVIGPGRLRVAVPPAAWRLCTSAHTYTYIHTYIHTDRQTHKRMNTLKTSTTTNNAMQTTKANSLNRCSDKQADVRMRWHARLARIESGRTDRIITRTRGHSTTTHRHTDNQTHTKKHFKAK